MTTPFNLKFRLQALEQRLRIGQLRSQLKDIDKELSMLQDIVAEAKRILQQADKLDA